MFEIFILLDDFIDTYYRGFTVLLARGLKRQHAIKTLLNLIPVLKYLTQFKDLLRQQSVNIEIANIWYFFSCVWEENFVKKK